MGEQGSDSPAIGEVVAALIERVERLEADNRRLTERLASPARSGTGTGTTTVAARDGGHLSRRGLLLGGAAAVAATSAAIASSSTPAAANTHLMSFTLGDPANSAAATTGVTASLGGTPTLSGKNPTSNGIGAYGMSNATSGVVTPGGGGAGVVGDSDSYPGVLGKSASANGVAGVSGGIDPTVPASLLIAGVAGHSVKKIGVLGSSLDDNGILGVGKNACGVKGMTGTSGFLGTAGVLGESQNQYGVAGFSANRSGVRAASSKAEGIRATSTSHLGGSFGGGRAAINLVPTGTTGRPTTGAHGRGDLVVDAVGALFVCTASGTPGTWVKVSTTPA